MSTLNTRFPKESLPSPSYSLEILLMRTVFFKELTTIFGWWWIFYFLSSSVETSSSFSIPQFLTKRNLSWRSGALQSERYSWSLKLQTYPGKQIRFLQLTLRDWMHRFEVVGARYIEKAVLLFGWRFSVWNATSLTFEGLQQGCLSHCCRI